MKTVISIVLILCLALSLYSFVFHNGEMLSFEDAYKGAISYVTDIGSVFNSIRNAIGNTLNAIVSLPNTISNWWNDLRDFLGFDDTETDYEGAGPGGGENSGGGGTIVP